MSEVSEKSEQVLNILNIFQARIWISNVIMLAYLVFKQIRREVIFVFLILLELLTITV
jgi:hypothetical protein